MAILVVCPGCKKSFKVDDKNAGKTGPCPNCKTKITIPLKQAEVKIHTPDEFGGGGKSVTGKLLLKPIARKEARVKPAMAAAIGGAAVAAIVWALVVRGRDPGPLRNWLIGIGLVLVSPPLAVASYTFLRDDELEPHRGQQLYIRAAVCAAVYMILWAVFAYVYGTILDSKVDLPFWLLLASPFLCVGAAAGKFSFDLETANGFFHYAFYVAVTLLLGWIAGLGFGW